MEGEERKEKGMKTQTCGKEGEKCRGDIGILLDDGETSKAEDT